MSHGLAARRAFLGAMLMLLVGAGCAGMTNPAEPTSRDRASTDGMPPLLARVAPPPATDAERDGEADGVDAAAATAAAAVWRGARAAAFVAADPPPPTAHPRVCDVRGLGDAVFVAHNTSTIDRDGARVHRYQPTGAPDARWSLAFDWDRGGAAGKTHEVGGQGFGRVRAIDERLWVTDADAPLYGGFGLADAPFEDYVFVSDAQGGFAALGPDQSPPDGTRLLPWAFHAFDVIPWRGGIVATGGTVALGAGHGRYPGGLFVGALDARALEPRWRVGGRGLGVVRMTFAHRFGGRLYVGVQNNERRARFDLAVLGGDDAAPVVARVSEDGGWLTRRFASGAGVLWWVASGYPSDGRPGTLFRSRDGLEFTPVALPAGAGDVEDILVLAGAHTSDTVVLVLTRTGLYRGLGADPAELVRLAAAPAGDPFGAWDTFCSAPLELAAGAVWAGGTRDGGLYGVEPAP